MTAATCTDEEFMRLFGAMGARALAERLNIGERHVHARRRRLEARYGTQLTSPNTRPPEHEGRLHYEVKNGTVQIRMDRHGPATGGVRAAAARKAE